MQFAKAYENYFKYLRSIFPEEWLGKWRVVWRDFETVKQDREFETANEAVMFAAKIVNRDIRPEIEEIKARGELEDAVNYWANMT